MTDEVRWSVTRVSTATTEPVSTTDAKAHLRVGHSDDDTYIAGLVKTAREWVEDEVGRSFALQTWDYRANDFPSSSTGTLDLPRSPLVNVNAVYYTPATATSESTMAATDYLVDTSSEPGRVYLKEGATWPTYRLRRANGVRVRFRAGYATTATGSAASTPGRAKHAIKLFAGELYYERGSDAEGPSDTVHRLIGPLNAKRYQ